MTSAEQAAFQSGVSAALTAVWKLAQPGALLPGQTMEIHWAYSGRMSGLSEAMAAIQSVRAPGATAATTQSP